MADKVVEQPQVAAEETEKDLKEKKTIECDAAEEKKTLSSEAEEKSEEAAEEVKENGNAEKEANGKASNGTEPAAEGEDKCCVKRKSTGGEAQEAKTEEVVPEKKAKLDESAPQEAESNGESEVAA